MEQAVIAVKQCSIVAIVCSKFRWEIWKWFAFNENSKWKRNTEKKDSDWKL